MFLQFYLYSSTIHFVFTILPIGKVISTQRIVCDWIPWSNYRSKTRSKKTKMNSFESSSKIQIEGEPNRTVSDNQSSVSQNELAMIARKKIL